MKEPMRANQEVPGSDSVRARLESERSRLTGLVAALESDGIDRESGAESLGELSSASQHQADTASETFERERDLGLLEDFRAELAETDRALRRLADSRYGVCETCHQPIAADRLEAVPSTRFCKTCQDRYELGGAMLAQPETPVERELGELTEFLADDDELVLDPRTRDPKERWGGPEESALHADSAADLESMDLSTENT